MFCYTCNEYKVEINKYYGWKRIWRICKRNWQTNWESTVNNKAMGNLDASTINYRKSPESIIIEQIEKEREKEGEFWATHSSEECVEKSMEDAKKLRNLQKV